MHREGNGAAAYFGATVRQRDLGSATIVEKLHEPGELLPRHEHVRPYLSFVLAGGYREETREGSTSCGPGILVVHPAGEPHADVFDERESRLLVVEPGPELLTGLVAEAYTRRAVIDAPWSMRLVDRLRMEMRTADEVSPLVVQGALLELAARVLRRPSSSGRRPAWLQEAHRVVLERFQTGVSLTGLAEEVGVHPSHLAREFRQTYGVSVGELVRRRRIEYALERLRSNDASLAEIAVDCGFTDQSHLTRSFRRVAGSTPGEYRRRIGTNRRAESPDS